MYDITHDLTLQKIAKLLQQNGYARINKSVWLGFEGPKDNKPLFEKVREMLRQPKTASSKLYVLPLTKTALHKLRDANGRKPSDLEFLMGDCQLMFF